MAACKYSANQLNFLRKRHFKEALLGNLMNTWLAGAGNCKLLMGYLVLFILIKQIHKCVNNHRGLIADYVAGPEECREFAHGANTLYGMGNIVYF